MIAHRFRFLAPVVLMPLALSVLHADVTLRYKTEVKLNPNLPEKVTAAARKAMDNAIPQERVLRFKDGKGYSTFKGFDSITDFTTKQITIVDAANKRYAKLQSDQMGDEMLRAMPAMPPEARAAIKTSVTPAKLTGRTAVILGVESEEHDLVFSIEGPAMPNMPPGPTMKMVMHFWTAKNAEIMRVPAIRELSGYSVWSYATMNPAAGMDKMLKQFPGFADAFMSMNQAMHQGTTLLRTQTDIFMPAMAAIMQRMPQESNQSGAGLDPDSPYLQMNEEAVEISTAPVPVSVFQVPDGYQETAPSELFKGMLPKGASEAAAQNQPDFVNAYVDRNLILHRVGDLSASVKLNKTALSSLTGTCDIAVRISRAEWNGDALHFGLEYIGGPSVPGQPAGNCTTGTTATELEISGFSSGESPESIMASVAQVLLTPEQYLAASGVAAFKVPHEDGVRTPQANSPEQPEPASRSPKILLRVNGGYTDAARKAKVQGDVTISVEVGVDGRVYSSRVIKGIGYGVDENALRAVSLWRFEPGWVGGRPVRVSATLEMNFRLL